MLSPQGRILIEVPNDDCREIDLSQLNHAPHLQFFSIESLRKLIEKNGFKVEFIDSCGPLLKNLPQLHTFAKSDKVCLYVRLIKKYQLIYKIFLFIYGFFIENWNNLIAYHRSDGVIDQANCEFSYGGARASLRAVIKRT